MNRDDEEFTFIYSVDGYCEFLQGRSFSERFRPERDAVADMRARGWAYSHTEKKAGPKGEDCLFFTRPKKPTPGVMTGGLY